MGTRGIRESSRQESSDPGLARTLLHHPRKEAGHDRGGRHDEGRAVALADHRPRLRAAGVAELLQSASDKPPNDVPRAGVAGMKRSFDLAVKAAAAAAFVLCVECFVWRRRCRIEKHAVSPRAPLRARREADARRGIFPIEGTPDEFAAPPLAYSGAHPPPPAPGHLDLGPPAPSLGGAPA